MAQVVIGSPGPIKKWISFKKLAVTRLKILVFDEADQMLAEDGFKDDSLRIMKEIEKFNSSCQVWGLYLIYFLSGDVIGRVSRVMCLA
ncbi:DEAD-box ATP-dependent RNA helicase 38 [Arachis hypogaea]|uniref:DEAD-box ATP-dependent RNA helicase 38 n=1 Tax=Arachis hypogaea TaxID=3818 RepID=UPI000DED1BAF|nr:DEAD-box ATP-dependent RNA helicase 38 [Arachis hypogaea]